MASIFLTYRPEQLSNGQYYINLVYVWFDTTLSRVLHNGNEITKADLDNGFYLVDSGADVILEFQYDGGIIEHHAQDNLYAYKIEFGTGFTKIGFNAFYNSSTLETVILPDYQIDWNYDSEGNDSYGSQFASCDELTTIVFPDGAYDYGYGMFGSCKGLVEVNVNASSISNSMFKGCHSLESITLSENVKSVGRFAFSDCFALQEIRCEGLIAPYFTFSPFGTSIYTGDTTQYNSFTTGGTLYYPKGGNYWTWFTGEYIANGKYLDYFEWNGVEVGDGILPTPEYTSAYVRISQESYIHEDLSASYSIGFNAELFSGNISKLYIDGLEVYDYIYNRAAQYDKPSDYYVYFVNDSEPSKHDVIIEFSDGIIPSSAFMDAGNFRSIYELEIGTGIIKVGNGAFSYQKFEELILPEADIEYGDGAFLANENLKKVQFPKTYNVTIGENLFDGDISLTDVDLGIQTTIPKRTFMSCSGLTSITIPSTVTSLGSSAFELCTNLVEITAEPTTAPSILNTTFFSVKEGGTLYYPAGSDYSTWLATNTYRLGFYGWNGVEVGGTTPPDTGGTLTHSLSVSPSVINAAYDYLTYSFTCTSENIDNIEAVYDVNWINVSNTLSGGTITVDNNSDTTSRNCTITFNGYYNGAIVATDTLKVYQDADDTPYVKILPTNKYEFAWDYEGSVGFTIETYGIDNLTVMGQDIPYATSFGNGSIDIQETYGSIWVRPNPVTNLHQDALLISGWKNGEEVAYDILDVRQEGKPEDEPDVPPTPDEPEEPDVPDVPVEKTPSVVVSKNNINLDNVGDTSIIQVTYINVDEIVPPEVPDGFTIEEIERVEGENGIQVKYKITRISPKRQNAQINFKGNTSGGKTATSSNVNLKGEPCPAEVRLSSYSITNNILTFPATGDTFHVDVIANGVNPPYEFSYSIDGNGITCTYNELDYDSGDGDLTWRYKFTSIPNNGNSPYTGTITFNYKDELTNKTIELPFYVRYANEGRIEAGAEKYAYDKDGNNLISTNGNRFSISYINMETINEPECDVDWLIVGEGVLDTGVYADERVKYNHSITIQPNEGASRRCTVTFSGKGVDGKNYTFDIEVTQEGDDTVKPIDEGFIELQQLSVVLNADGDAQTFQVKYYDAKTIYEPELAGTWATITEVSRTEPVPDTAWNGEECESVIVTYQVTGQPTDSGRQMKVKFKSDINYYDGGVVYMEKDKFIIYQLAEGSTEVQGLVSILRYSNTFTYYGSPTGWNFRVAYDNVTPATPVISESWCRIAEVKDLNADEYDYYKEYILEMDTNNSNFSRTCTITFIGNAEDGTQIKTPFQFTQQGQEEIVNEGEYANYKGYFMDFEGALHSVSFITNPRSDAYGDIRLAGDSPVVVSYSENEYLYDPIRTSTCTVKVVSSHYLMNLYSGKAQGTQVILRNEDTNTIEWCGFLQPNLYNQGFTECIEEIEFEASDCLSTLQYLRYEYFYNGNGQPMIVSFKNIVDTIADRCKLINSYVFTQKLYSNSDESKIFDFKEFYISENNFYSEEGEPWTYQEVLEETCKYFGYVCFQWGDRIYFMDYDKYNSDKSMVGYRYVKEDNWYNRNYITLSNPNRITEKSIRGTGADISLDDVFNKVSVNCNYYNLEHLLPDLFEDELLTERNQMTLTTVVNRGQEIGSKTSYIVYDHKNIKSHFYKPIVGESIHEIEVQPTEDEFNKRTFFTDFVGANIVDMYYLNYSDLNGKTFESKEWEKYLMISQLNRPWCKGPIVGENDTTKYWENYNFPIMEFTQIPQIFIDNHKEVYESNTTTGGRVPTTRVGFGTSSSTPNSRPSINTNKSEHYLVIRAEGAFTPFFVESYVPENVDEKGFNKWSNTEYGGYTFDLIKDTTKKEQNFAPKLTFYLEIPTAGWWDGSKWVDYETWFEVPLEELHYSDEIWYSWKNTQNKVETNLFLGISGYKIQLPESMESTAFMQFKIGMPKRFAHVSGGDDNGEAGNAFCFIKNLEMDIVSRNTALLKDEDVCFENVIDDNNVIDGPEWDLKITSDNNITYSFSTVSTKYGEDMVNTTNFRFYDLEGELILPEEAIINKFVNQYSTPTLKENMTVDMSFTPAQMITDTYWGDKDFVIVAQELDFQMCKQQITLLEKK